MGDYQHQLVFRQFFQRLKHLLTGGRVQRTGGFVRHNNLRALNQRSCDGNSLLLTAGQCVRLAFGITFQVHLFQKLPYRRLVLGLVLQFQRQGNIILHRKLIENVILLENKAHKGVAVAVKILLREVFTATALNDHLTGGGAVQSAADIQKR